MEEEMVKTEVEATEESKRTIGETIDSGVDSLKEFANGLEAKDVGLGVVAVGGTVLVVKGIVNGAKKIEIGRAHV